METTNTDNFDDLLFSLGNGTCWTARFKLNFYLDRSWDISEVIGAVPDVNASKAAVLDMIGSWQAPPRRLDVEPLVGTETSVCVSVIGSGVEWSDIKIIAGRITGEWDPSFRLEEIEAANRLIGYVDEVGIERVTFTKLTDRGRRAAHVPKQTRMLILHSGLPASHLMFLLPRFQVGTESELDVSVDDL